MSGKTVLIKVFTHPTCTSCRSAIQIVDRLASGRKDLSVQIISLASKGGREEARKENVLSVPTILVGRNHRFVGVPRWEDLVGAIDAEASLV